MMYERITKIFLLFLLFILQACSGGKIGNFLESSFENIDTSKQENNQDNLSNNNTNQLPKLISDQKVMKDYEVRKINKKITNIEAKNIKLKKKKDFPISEKEILEEKNTLSEKDKYDIRNSLKKNKKFKLESYRITVILNQVDPSSPLEDFSKVLKNSNLNFEIENIQRFSEDKSKYKKE